MLSLLRRYNLRMLDQDKTLAANKATSENTDTPDLFYWKPVVEKLIRDEQYAIFLMEQDQEGHGLFSRFSQTKRRFRNNNE